ncbi:MAG TPA: glycosyltransferase family 39 protein [Acidobacteriaceae bacterium]|nr:glycosyltransferase family 39 protein [Acidobacteriaceae bacterium]
MTVAAAETRDAALARPQRAAFRRWILPSLAVVSVLAACIIRSLATLEVGDEIYTHVELSDPSLVHLFRTVPHLGGAGMPLFYLTFWSWSRLFGLSDLSLRLCASIAICGAFLLLFAMLRRRFGDRAAFIGAAFGFFAPITVIDAGVETRTYGLYLLLAVLAVRQWLTVADTPRPRARDLALLALTQAGLVLGHVLGLIYASILLAALIALDAFRHRFRPLVYLSFMAGWLALIPWIPAILTSAAAGKPRGWIPMPGIGSFAMGLSCWNFLQFYWPAFHNHLSLLGLAWIVATALIFALVFGAIRRLRTAPAPDVTIIAAGLALVLAPEVFFVVSRAAQPIFLPRYMIPTAMGVAILCACWAQRSRLAQIGNGRTLGPALVLLPLAAAMVPRPAPVDAAALDRIAAGRPLVCDYSRDFLVVWRYSAHPRSIEYPLDWQAALRGPQNAPTDFHLMENYRREGYFPGSLPTMQELLRRKSFLLLDSTNTNWFQLEIASNPRFSWSVLRQIDPEHRVIEVTQLP